MQGAPPCAFLLPSEAWSILAQKVKGKTPVVRINSLPEVCSSVFIYQSGALNVYMALAGDNEFSLDSLPARPFTGRVYSRLFSDQLIGPGLPIFCLHDTRRHQVSLSTSRAQDSTYRKYVNPGARCASFFCPTPLASHAFW